VEKRAKPSTSANPPKYHMSEEEKKAEKKAYKEKSGPVKTATKSQKMRMQKTVEKQRRKGLAKAAEKSKKMISDSSKTPGETKPKRTGLDKTWRSWKTKIASIPGAGGIRGGWGSGKRH